MHLVVSGAGPGRCMTEMKMDVVYTISGCCSGGTMVMGKMDDDDGELEPGPHHQV